MKIHFNNKEIDILVDLAWKIPGVIGSRITGGGFGGCTVSIVKNDAVDTFIETIGKKVLKILIKLFSFLSLCWERIHLLNYLGSNLTAKWLKIFWCLLILTYMFRQRIMGGGRRFYGLGALEVC